MVRGFAPAFIRLRWLGLLGLGLYLVYLHSLTWGPSLGQNQGQGSNPGLDIFLISTLSFKITVTGIIRLATTFVEITFFRDVGMRVRPPPRL